MTRLKGTWICGSGLLVTILLIAGCCSAPVDLDQFKVAQLESQIGTIESANQAGCHLEERVALLGWVADHGYPAADAMIDLLEHPRKDFRATDAIEVLVLIHLKGYDLRDHAAVKTLTWVSTSSADGEVRADAMRAITKIEASRPARSAKG